jgi:hypothetical protein
MPVDTLPCALASLEIDQFLICIPDLVDVCGSFLRCFLRVFLALPLFFAFLGAFALAVGILITCFV